MSSPEKARDFRALGSAIFPLEPWVLGVGVVVTDGVKTGGSNTGASKGLVAPGIEASGPSLECKGGRVRV